MDEEHRESYIHCGADKNISFLPAVGDAIHCDIGRGVVTARHFKFIGSSHKCC
jgi:hypothetical protein